MIDISPIQIIIVLAIALLVFGPKRLPEMGRSIGRGIREVRTALVDEAPRADPPRRAARAPAPPAPADTPPPAEPRDREDDVLEGVVVPGDTPPPPRRSRDA